MHEDEVAVDAALLTRLLAAQFPQWAGLAARRLPSAGTDNALFRLGSDLVVRLPRIHWAVDQVEKEHVWLPRLAPHLPLALPTPLAQGRPGMGYPWPWSIYRWLPGRDAGQAPLSDPLRGALQLADFIHALQRIDPTGGPDAAAFGLRGVPLQTRDAATRQAISELAGKIDTAAATAAWETALDAPPWDGPPAWFHGDLLPGNVLVENGRLSAVIDFGGLGVGDPAPDLMIAWHIFSGRSRETFRRALGVDDATWARGRGHALSQALIFAPYYWHSSPVGVRAALHAIEQVLAS